MSRDRKLQRAELALDGGLATGEIDADTLRQGDVVQQFQGLQRGGRVSQQEFGEFQQINGRMNQLVSSLFQQGAGMGDCQQVLGFLQNAMGAVQRMGQVDPRLESCKGQVRLAWSEAQSAFNNAARSKMTPQKVQIGRAHV